MGVVGTWDQACGYSPLMVAVEYGRTNVVKVLLQHGADREHHNKVGMRRHGYSASATAAPPPYLTHAHALICCVTSTKQQCTLR
jgi:hypothetical protein